MVEPADLSSVVSAEPAGPSDVQQVTVRQDVVGSTIIAGHGNVVTQTVTIIHQNSRAEPEPEEPVKSPTGFPPSPYKGLESFYEDDADRFFGRSPVVDTLWRRLRDLQIPPLPGQTARARLLSIIGPSGSGKSSVVRAGLVPELARRPIPGLANPRVAVVVPHTEPIEALANVLARLATNDPAPAAKTREFADEIRYVNPSGIPDGLRRVANVLPGADRHPLILLVDQFEEVFTGAAEAGRSLFIETLLDAASDSSGRISVVLTLRSDFLSATARYPSLDAAIAACSELVPAMSEAELKEAISLPAARAAMDAGIPNPLDQGTVELLVRETIGREGALPLLQFSLHRIWEGLAKGTSAADTLRELGGVGGALAAEADRLVGDLAQSGKEDLVRRAFLAMVQLGEGVEDTRRRARLSEIVASGETTEEVMTILRRFARPGERLVTFGSDRGETTLEVTHEQLIARWPTLQSWLRDWREDERFRRRLAGAARDWRDGQGSLWGPTELELLRRWRERPGQAATPEQQDFIDESEAALRKQQQQRRRITRLTRIAALVFLVLFLGTAGLAWLSYKRTEIANQQRQIAISQQLAAQALVDLPMAPQRSLLMAVQSIAMASAAGAIDPAGPIRLLHTILASAGGRPLTGHSGPVLATAFSHDGRWLATGSADGTARLWDTTLPTPLPIVLPGHADAVNALAFSPDRRWLVTAGENGTAALWDLTALGTADPVPLRGQKGAFTTVTFSPAGRWLAAGQAYSTVLLWDLSSAPRIPAPMVLRESTGNDGRGVTSLAFSADGRRLAAGDYDNSVHIWTVDANGVTGAPLTLHHGDGVLALALSPDGTRLGVARAYTVQIWDLTTADPRWVFLDEASQWILAIAFSPDGRWLAAGGIDGLVRLWDLTDPSFASRHPVLRGHTGVIQTIAFTPDSRWLVTAGGDATTRLWDLTDSTFPSIATRGHEGSIRDIAVDPAGRRLATASDDTTARLWTIPDSSAEPTVLHEPGCAGGSAECDAVKVVAFSHDGRWLASAGPGKTVILRTPGDPARAPVILSGHGADVSTIAFSPDDRWVAATSTNAAWLWDLTGAASPAKPLVMGGHRGPITAVAFSEDVRWFATASWDRTVRVWDMTADLPAAPRYVLLGHQAAIRSFSFSADGKRLISASGDPSSSETIGIVWDMTAADPAAHPIMLKGHRDVIIDVAASPPDGRWVATAGWDGTARLWDLKSVDPSASPRVLDFRDRVFGGGVSRDPAPPRVSSVAFSQNGHWLAAAAWNHRIQLVDVQDPVATPKPLSGPQGRIWSVTFSPDGRWLAAVVEDQSIWLWNPSDLAQEPLILHGHSGHIAFSPDGRWLATGSLSEATTRLWSLDKDVLLGAACRTAGRELMEEEWYRALPSQPYQKICDIPSVGNAVRSPR
jgi:WD40 repeat protein